MTVSEHRRTKRPLRLTDETVGGRRRSAPWVTMTVAGALGIDRGLAALGIARPLLIVSGFWRSGTTWLQECLAESLGAKTVFEPLSPMEPKRRAALGGAFAAGDARPALVPGPEPVGGVPDRDRRQGCAPASQPAGRPPDSRHSGRPHPTPPLRRGCQPQGGGLALELRPCLVARRSLRRRRSRVAPRVQHRHPLSAGSLLGAARTGGGRSAPRSALGA